MYGVELDKFRLASALREVQGIANVRVILGRPYGIPLKEEIVDFVLFKGVLYETHMVSRALQEAARVCRDTGRILVVDFEAFEKNWLKRSNLKWRLQHPWKILSHPLTSKPVSPEHNFPPIWRAGLSLEKYEANFATGASLDIVFQYS